MCSQEKMYDKEVLPTFLPRPPFFQRLSLLTRLKQANELMGDASLGDGIIHKTTTNMHRLFSLAFRRRRMDLKLATRIFCLVRLNVRNQKKSLFRFVPDSRKK